MGKHVAIALGTLALTAGIAASGCSGGSDSDAESPAADTESPAADAEGPVDSSEFRAEFKERFGVPPNEESPSWYRHITAINMGNRYLEITTDLGPKQGETALAICREAAGIALDFGIEGAKVKGSDGVGLVGCA